MDLLRRSSLFPPSLSFIHFDTQYSPSKIITMPWIVLLVRDWYRVLCAIYIVVFSQRCAHSRFYVGPPWICRTLLLFCCGFTRDFTISFLGPWWGFLWSQVSNPPLHMHRFVFCRVTTISIIYIWPNWRGVRILVHFDYYYFITSISRPLIIHLRRQ